MSEKKSSYQQIIKATSIFGGVQVFNIIVNIIRTKFVAILLGPSGMGIAGLLNTTISLMAGFTSFGLGISAVKDISAAHGSGNKIRVSRIATVIRRWVWITGILGAVLTFLFSSWLSELTFGNKNYTYAFILVSITLLLNQISTGQNVVLRGLRKLSYLAQASTLGSLLGLITTVPLYYFFGIDGIVPGIIVTSVSSLLLTWFYARKVELKPVKVSKIRTIAEGKDMLKFGLILSVGSLIGLGVSYVVRIFISNVGGVDQVGLYNAGFAIVNSYVGMIFTAMSADYYPRLTTVADNVEKSNVTINQQAEIAVLILAPIIMLFLVYINWVVILLYSTKFIAVNNMIQWAAMGILFKAASWSIGFLFLAKGAKKVFFWNELVTNIYLLVFNLVGYYYWGLSGLGISLLLTYILYVFQVYFVAKIKFDFSFNIEFYKIFIFQVVMSAICLTVVKFFDSPYSYIFGSTIIIVSTWYSYKELDERINFRSILKSWRDKPKD